MDAQTSERRWEPLLWLGLALAALLAVVARLWRRRYAECEATRQPVALPEVPPGLTEEEAAARWTEGQDNVIQLQPARTRKQIWRENTLTILNLSLVGLGVTQMLLQQWWSAILSLATIVLNAAVNVIQESLAQRRLAEFQRSARPQATVVREGKTRSIDPSRVVQGDVVIMGRGDQFLADGKAVGTGQMVVDESIVTGKRSWHTVRTGDPVYAGSFCVSGRGAYLAEKVGDERLIVGRMNGMPAPAKELTPLERLVDRILRVLLIVVAVFAVVLLVNYFRLDPSIPVAKINDAAGIVFSIAPSGLFLMIVVTYAAGSADLTKLGALVRRARSVESLAEATVICFAEAGILLAGTLVEIEPVPPPPGEETERLPESRLRQILGDFARSTAASSGVTRVLLSTFQGNSRALREEAPFLAALGWNGFSFEEPDLPGVYVLGEPAILKRHLVASVPQPAGGAEGSPAHKGVVKRLTSPIGRFFRRGDQGSSASEAKRAAHLTAPESAVGQKPTLAVEAPRATQRVVAVAEERAPVPEAEAQPGEAAARLGDAGAREPFLRRWVQRVRRTVGGDTPEGEKAPVPHAAAVKETVLLFAYRPDAAPLYDAAGNAQLPSDLIPLCQLRYARQLRPEAVEIVKALVKTGIRIKLFASEEPETIVSMIRNAGLRIEDKARLLAVGTVSGRDLEQLSGAALGRAAVANSVFGHITPEQGGELVRALRQSGEMVAVMGDDVNDLPALRQANLAIARQTSTQAALGVADIVMLENSPGALLNVLYKGQGIVHGLLAVLKLNLTQVFYLALLIAAVQLVSTGFPYAGPQGSAIIVITVAFPSIGLGFWGPAGVVASGRFGQILARFVAPAAVTMSAAGLLVYLHFMDLTGELAYAQLAVTYTLIYTGLLLAVFALPPRRTRRGKQDGLYRREWRMVAMTVFLGVVTYFLPWIPPARKYLLLDWLQPPDYAFVALVVVGWALIVNIVWWLIPGVDVGEQAPGVAWARQVAT